MEWSASGLFFAFSDINCTKLRLLRHTSHFIHLCLPPRNLKSNEECSLSSSATPEISIANEWVWLANLDWSLAISLSAIKIICLRWTITPLRSFDVDYLIAYLMSCLLNKHKSFITYNNELPTCYWMYVLKVVVQIYHLYNGEISHINPIKLIISPTKLDTLLNLSEVNFVN